jgi:adenine-specific DNA glycosylase
MCVQLTPQGVKPFGTGKSAVVIIDAIVDETSARLSLHHGRHTPVVGANVSRSLSRMTSLPFNRDPRHVKWIQELAERLTPRRAFRDFNYAVLDFTMTVCVPRIAAARTAC